MNELSYRQPFSELAIKLSESLCGIIFWFLANSCIDRHDLLSRVDVVEFFFFFFFNMPCLEFFSRFNVAPKFPGNKIELEFILREEEAMCISK